MATAMYVLLITFASLSVTPVVFADDCKPYTDTRGVFHYSRSCGRQFCCGSCYNRYCCSSYINSFDEDAQENCESFENVYSTVYIGAIVGACIIVIIIFICCCVCPCCCLYKMCRRPRPVLATTTHTVINTSYPQQPTASPSQGYQATHYSGYQPVQQSYGGQPMQPAYGAQPMQPGYGAQPMQPAYGAQPMQPAYGAQPMQPAYGAQPMPTAPYHGQPGMPGPPPPYQEAGSGFPAAVPYSQAAFTPGQTPYPLQPPAQPAQGPPQPDFHSSQPAYNPAYVEPQPPKTGF